MFQLDEHTVSLLHFDDGIKDETGKVWTVHGGATVTTDQYKFGKSSLYLNGTDGYLSTPISTDFDFPDDMTLEAWVYYSSPAGRVNRILGLGANASSTNPTQIWFGMGSHACVGNGWTDLDMQLNYGYRLANNSDNVDFCTSNVSGSVPTKTWMHLAVVRHEGVVKYYANGVEIYSVKDSSVLTPSASKDYAYIGARNNNGSIIEFFNGYIDELRISNIARYNGKFDPGNPQTNPISGNQLLRVTMSDSSEREYRLFGTQIDAFVKWYDRTVNTGNTCYTFNDPVDGSKEYLAFEKIISFKVIPLAQ